MKSYIDTKAINCAAVTHRKCSLNSNEDPLFKIFKVIKFSEGQVLVAKVLHT